MFSEFERVKIKETGITGVIVDITTINGEICITVESDEKGVPGGSGDEDSWKLFDCKEGDLEKIR